MQETYENAKSDPVTESYDPAADLFRRFMDMDSQSRSRALDRMARSHMASVQGPVGGVFGPIGPASAGAEASNRTMEQARSEEFSLDNIEDAMKYQPWNRDQTARGDQVREALVLAAKAILRNVPRSPRRTLALQHIISARMDANAAISFNGRF